MSHAEAVHTLQPAAGATAALVAFIGALRHDALDAEVRHYARRHLLDTVGVMICGAEGEVANRAERALAAVRGAGRIPVPGRARRADMLDAAFLGGTAAHGIELDDGYRQGSVHPGCAVVPAVLSAGYEMRRERRGGDRSDRRRLRDDDRDRAGLPSRPAPARLSSDRGLRGVRRRRGDGQAARLSVPARSPMRSASRPAVRPACSPSSTAAPTSSACTPATPPARACRRCCSQRLACRGRRT